MLLYLPQNSKIVVNLSKVDLNSRGVYEMNRDWKQYLDKEFLLSNKDKIIKAAVVIVLMIIAIFSFAFKGSGEDSKDMTISEQTASKSSEIPERIDKIMVDVSGAVKEPKVVELDDGSRVTDAIEAAGGLADDADVTQINRAAFISDGEKIYVPKIGDDIENDISQGTISKASTSSGKVDLNTATSEELQTINGIGPATAEKILQYRNDVGYFKSIDDIKNVNGIGDKTFENIKEYIKV